MLALDESSRRVKHVISTAALDRSNRMVDVGGWRLSRYRDNPVVLADHGYSIANIIGRAYDTKIEGGALISTTEFASDGLGDVAFRLVQAGLANSWSVGWIGLRQHNIGQEESCDQCNAAIAKNKNLHGTHFTAQELLEYSLVAIPANPEAVMGLARAGLIGTAEAEEWIKSSPVRDEPEAEPVTEPNVVIPERSSQFYASLFDVTRNVARVAAARRSSLQFRSQQ